jgi:D-glycero-alpha-D-manno-heptose 1-phosphate guanylyltransferase
MYFCRRVCTEKYQALNQNRCQRESRVPLSSNAGRVKAVLLVGGLGTRLRSVVQSTPKSLAPIGNGSFLELLVRQLASQGIQHLIMCTGYLADCIERKFGDGKHFEVEIEYSREPEALGTAGAIKLAQRYLEGLPYFLVLNGDSFLDINLNHLIETHQRHDGLATIAAVSVGDAGCYGTVFADPQDRIVEFCEKTGQNSPGVINGGVYVFSPAIFEHIPNGPVSLERDVFPKILDKGVYVLRHEGTFIDIGTPADYSRAQQLFDRGELAASPKTRLCKR